jgi:hypothetical protein
MLCQHVDVRYPALSVCISNAHRTNRINIQQTAPQSTMIDITSEGKSNEFPNTLACPHVISDFYQFFPVTFHYVPKVMNTACFLS